MNAEEILVTSPLGEVLGRGWSRYPNEKPGRAGTLLPPVSGAAAWFDPSDLTSLTFVNAGVSQLNDKSGGGANATQSTAASRPMAGPHPTVLNRNGALLFTRQSKMSTTYTASDRTETSFFVGVVADVAEPRTLIGGSSVGARQIRVDQTNGKITCNSQFSSGIFTTTTLAASPGVPFVLCVKLDSTSWEVRLNSGTPETGSNSTAFTGSLTSRIGENPSSGNEPWCGLLGEILIYSTTLSSGDIDLTMAYLRTKWGI